MDEINASISGSIDNTSESNFRWIDLDWVFCYLICAGVNLKMGVEEKHKQVNSSRCISSCILTPPSRSRWEAPFDVKLRNGQVGQIASLRH